MLRMIFATFVALTISTNAYAGCWFGQKNLPGSLGPGDTDNSRSFTVRNGDALFIVRTRNGRPITANRGCGWSTGSYHACRVFTNQHRREVFASLQNNTGRQITYRWICRH